MAFMEAVALVGSSKLKSLAIAQKPRPSLPVARPDEAGGSGPYAIVRLHAAALNHRDVWMTKGLYPRRVADGTTPGADGCGTVVQVSPGSCTRLLGQRVLINPTLNWGPDPMMPSSGMKVIGETNLPGTFAEYILVPLDRLHMCPSFLSDAQAAALPLAGVTAYRALVTQANAKRGDRILITGVGGGVALMAVQLAVALGCEIWVTSSSADKIKRARQLGALGGALYTQSDWCAQLGDITFDAVVDGSGGQALNDYMRLLRRGGSLVTYGATAGLCVNPPFNVFALFLQNLSFKGTAMGSDHEFAALLRLVTEQRVVPVVDSVFPLQQASEAFARMDAGLQFGKIVLTCGAAEKSAREMNSLTSKL